MKNTSRAAKIYNYNIEFGKKKNNVERTKSVLDFHVFTNLKT